MSPSGQDVVGVVAAAVFLYIEGHYLKEACQRVEPFTVYSDSFP